MKDRDGNEWVLVPKNAVREMLDAAHFGPNSAEDALNSKDEQFWLDVWSAMTSAAPKFEAPEVDDAMCERIWVKQFPTYADADALQCAITRRWLEAWRSELGPNLGLVQLREPSDDECRALYAFVMCNANGSESVEQIGRAMFTSVSKWLKGEL